MANYLIRNAGGTVQGPFSVSEIQQLIKLGRVTPTTEIQQEGGQTWRRAAEIKGIAAALGVPLQVRQNPAELPPTTSNPRVTAPPPEQYAHTTVGVTVAPHAGFSDRILRSAFQFARSISVLVIAGSIVTIAGSLLLGGYALMPSPASLVGGVDTPDFGEFLTSCKPEAPTQGQPKQPRQAIRSVIGESDSCSIYRQGFTSSARNLKVDEDRAVTAFCNVATRLPEEWRGQFSNGLIRLSEAYVSSPPREADCTGADAANWYIGTFQNRLAERQAQALLDQQAAAERRQLLIPALSGIGTAIGALLMFLILPLLIQIERNTRTA